MTDQLEEIRALLHHKYIRKRKRGIRKAADLLAQDLHRQELHTMLAEIARDDLISGVRELARRALEEDDRRHQGHPPQYTQGEEHMVGGPCRHCGHPNYYDKRVVCQEEKGYREIRRGEKTLSVIAVTCEECGEGFKIEDVDCEGYR